MGDFEKKFPASACRKKKIACSTNVIESLWKKKGKNVLPARLLEKKFLMTRNHPPLPSRVKWSAPKRDLSEIILTTTKKLRTLTDTFVLQGKYSFTLDS